MLKAKDGEFFVTDWLRNRNTMEFLGVCAATHRGQTPCVAESKYPSEFKGIPYASIIAEYWQRMGGEPTKGSRLMKQIVSALEVGIPSEEIEAAEAVAAETGVKVNVKALPMGVG